MVVIGDRYGLLTVIADVLNTARRKVLVKCDCGVAKVFVLGNLRSGGRVSCGCKSRKYSPENYIGKKFGRLKVLEDAGYIDRSIAVLCKCDCGNEIKVRLISLVYEQTKSCGCLRAERVSEARLADVTGKRFGSLTVIKRAENSPRSAMSRWHCKCDCGNETIVFVSNLNDGSIGSCGCGQGKGTSIPWTSENEDELISLLNAKIEWVEISEKIKRTRPAIRKRLELMKREKNLKVCATDDCRKYFIAKLSTAKYCSDQCRWRKSKRKTYKKRAEKGLCKQCGRVEVVKTESYCIGCREYFRKRHNARKESEEKYHKPNSGK